MGKVRILLVDDHPLMRDALRGVIGGEPDLEVIAEAEDGDTAVAQALKLQPDLLLLDVALPGMPGLEVTQRLKRELPRTRILALSAHEDETPAGQLLAAGAEGYATKHTGLEELLRAIRAVAAGERYVDPVIARRLRAAAQQSGGPSDLTREEMDVLRQFAQGYTQKQIASSLRLSEDAVVRFKGQGMQKLGAKTRAEVARRAAEQGWR